MKNRTSINFWLDLVSLVVMVGLTATGALIYLVLPPGTGHHLSLFGLSRHDYGDVHLVLAVAALVLLILHLLMHWSWVCCVTAKLAGRSAPSPSAQRGWGLSLLIGLPLVMAVGLWGLSGLVQPVAGAVADADHGSVQTAALGSGKLSGARGDRQGADRGTHCAAGQRITGQLTLFEAGRLCGMSADELQSALGLPEDVFPDDTLGRLRRRHGLSIHEVRRIACR